ncbi:nicotinate-nucleotide adenylyltransferase [Oryzibacter oryziterrae]|uniref:nicotinate-nucleotide adenylyltransferase n=1 Tax=Oryzibacter oryziterrae TaxID=2766474 RepID=UPI001F266E3A|nr:nicotinate-nucleotide adenylyltransferase [Oryzibacter oryziterrae]
MSTRPRLPPTLPGMTVGLFGGSFNPPHEGHAHVARLALMELGLDRIWWLVTPGNPLKDVSGLPSIENRLAAVRRIARHPRAVVTDLEARLGTRYTVDLVRRLTRLRPHVRFVLVIGADNWASFHRWGGWQDIAARVAIAVIDRPGATFRALASPAARRYATRRLPERQAAHLSTRPLPAWTFLAGHKVPISSTALRGMTKAGRQPS